MAVKIRNIHRDIQGIKSDDGFYAKFENEGSSDLTVNGGETPVVFTLEDLPTGQMILLQSISFLIGTEEVLDLDKFSNLTGLAEGILFQAGEASAVIKTNADVFLISSHQISSTAGQGTNTFTLINGRWDFSDTFGGHGAMVMNADDLKITIRDNISGASFFKMSCHGILIEEN